MTLRDPKDLAAVWDALLCQREEVTSEAAETELIRLEDDFAV
ncbi:MAG TPA: hypothetical protein VMH41_12275 [Mycobacteriales bacterium]|nr:hypothetical protein [Mycobacteriales bacterium]